MCDILDMLSEKLDETISSLDEQDASWPDLGNMFWTYDQNDGEVYWDVYDGGSYHAMLRTSGLCFKTVSEAHDACEDYMEEASQESADNDDGITVEAII